MVIHRAFHKLDFLTTSSGIPTGMEFGTFRILESLQKKLSGEIILVYDCPLAASELRKINPEYKSTRGQRSPEFYSRIEKLQNALNMVWTHSLVKGKEADSVLYNLSRELKGPHFIYSNDDDLLQAIDDSLGVQVVKSHESTLYYWDEVKVMDKYFLPPSLLVMLRAFIGDSSDNLPGVPRLPKKLMAEAILHSLNQDGIPSIEKIKTENLFGPKIANSLIEFIDSGLFLRNFLVMELSHDCRPPVIPARRDNQKLIEFFTSLEIYTLNICKEIGMDSVEENEEF